MARRKQLSQRQKSFAEKLVFSQGLRTATEIAKEVGYGSPNVRASELQNPNKFPLVVEYIDLLRMEKEKETKKNFYKVLEKFTKVLDQATNQISRELCSGRTAQASSLMGQTKPIIHQFKQMISNQNESIKVYLAEENRPYHTGFYKIGRTSKDNVEDRRTFTDNPFGIHYIAFIDYVPENNFNLEKTLHTFFLKYSTKSHIENGSTEWFQFKNKHAILKGFMKASRYFLNRFDCKYLIKIREDLV